MQTTASPHAEGTLFTLRPECAQDQAFIDALHLERHVAVQGFEYEPSPDGRGDATSATTVLVSARSKAALEAKAGREFASALRKLLGLCLGEAAGHGHVGTNAPNPQPQEQLATSLEKLELVLQAFGEVVSQQGAVLKEMQCAHQKVSVCIGGESILAQQGGAA